MKIKLRHRDDCRGHTLCDVDPARIGEIGLLIEHYEGVYCQWRANECVVVAQQFVHDVESGEAFFEFEYEGEGEDV